MTCLQVHGSAKDIEEARMRELFGRFGNVVSVKLAREARIYKQYGFVHYILPSEAEAAINAMNNVIIVARRRLRAHFKGLRPKKRAL